MLGLQKTKREMGSGELSLGGVTETAVVKIQQPPGFPKGTNVLAIPLGHSENTNLSITWRKRTVV